MTEQKLKKLPLGLTDFRKIIEGEYVYVDKTQLIYQLITSGEYYFISRPRRFGKSLLVSTLAELFSGNRELFKNLWINSSDYDWQKYPVIKIDFSRVDYSSIERLEKSLSKQLYAIAKKYQVVVEKTDSVKDLFSELIDALSLLNNVVVLIDEYDKPILDNIQNRDQANKFREFLQNFYSIIKASDQHVRFVLLTGVSKFAKTSIFSGINNLSDVSIDTRYAIMLGYTHQEITNYFTPYLERLSKTYKYTFIQTESAVTNYYDGYQFTENSERMFNPYSVMRCFDAQKFESYWFASGAPTFLIKLLQKGDYDLRSVTKPVLNAEDLGNFEIDNIPLSSLLFQTGYLTIKAFDQKTNNYTLGIPNKEVDNGFVRQLANVFTLLTPDKSIEYARIMFDSFAHNNMHELEQKLQDFFNKMPYTVHIKSESQLQFVLYAIFALIGVTVDPEVTTSLGRADLVVALPKLVYVIELKFNGSAVQALEQIRDKKYYEKYENTDKHITLVGINFDEPTKTVSLEAQKL